MWIPYIGLGGGVCQGVEIFVVTYIRKALQSAQIMLTKKLGSSDVEPKKNQQTFFVTPLRFAKRMAKKK